MDKIDAMRALTRVISLGSFAGAGRSLGLTRSAIGKAIADLETDLGARLLHRTTRQVRPTDAGLAYYERALEILAAVEEADREVSSLQDSPRGVLRINAPISFGILHLSQAVSQFAALYPDVKVELVLNDRFIDPVEESFDVTIRIAELSDSSLIARRLSPARLVLAASPAYLAQAGALDGPKDLIHHRCLVYGQTTPNARWQITRGGKTQVVSVESAYCSNNGDVLRKAAIDGLGIAPLPTFLIGPDLAEGRLVEVLADWTLPALGIYALYAPNRFLPAKTRLLIDHLSKCFGPDPEWDAYRHQRPTGPLE